MDGRDDMDIGDGNGVDDEISGKGIVGFFYDFK